MFGWVDLGSFDSIDAATGSWRAAAEAFPGAFVGRKQRVQLHMEAGRAAFRLYAEGFTDPGDVAAFCEELRAGGRACGADQ